VNTITGHTTLLTLNHLSTSLAAPGMKAAPPEPVCGCAEEQLLIGQFLLGMAYVALSTLKHSVGRNQDTSIQLYTTFCADL
jgi:hypothetical protein